MVEVLVAGAILVFCLCGLLVTYVDCFILNETTRNTTLTVSGARAKLEEVKQESFDNLMNRNGETFDIQGLAAAKGRVEVSNIADYPDLRQVRIIVCWRQSQNRVIGEDKNLNGALDSAEDTNANNRLDSPIEAITFISR